MIMKTTQKKINNQIELKEKIEKHDTLNQKLFDAEGKLKEDVRKKMLQIADTFLESLEEDNITIVVSDIILIGSNASYNYTDDSDIDIHLIADTGSLNCPEELYSALYSAYRSLFNKKYDISIYDIPVELYVETDNTLTKSNGIYSIKENEWIKEPEQLDIPEINQAEIDRATAPWEKKCIKLIDDFKSGKIVSDTAYDRIEALIEDLYDLRKTAISTEGEYALGNLVFKEIRNKGLLDQLKDLKNQATSQWLTLESLQEELSIKKLDEYRVRISQLTHTQPIVQSNGYFFIHNVKESDINFILNILNRQNFIEYVRRGAGGKYDFSHINPGRLPQQLFTIEGKLMDF